jgi:hypothetical protein
LFFSSLGIGGFVVKIRGNRRRQDLLHMDSELLRTKNKRLRKTILEEHMPPEMQVKKKNKQTFQLFLIDLFFFCRKRFSVWNLQSKIKQKIH